MRTTYTKQSNTTAKTSNQTSTSKMSTASILTRITNSKGRFFGLSLKSGETFNAQFRRETPAYVMVYDRTSSTLRRVLKTSIVNTTA